MNRVILSMADESDTSDESLDAGSDKFDPLKALYSPKTRMVSSAPTYDNVSKFEAVLKGIHVSTKVRIPPRARDMSISNPHPREPTSPINKSIEMQNVLKYEKLVRLFNESLEVEINIYKKHKRARAII